MLCSWNEPELRETVSTIEERGGTARSVVADVTNPEDLERLASTAIEEFGTIDTWVNNAGVSIYGTLTEVAIEEAMFDPLRSGTRAGEHAGNLYAAAAGLGLSVRRHPLAGEYRRALTGYWIRTTLPVEGTPLRFRMKSR